jgi:hypothetical protein
MRTKVTLVLLFLNVALFFFIFRFEREWRTEQAALESRRRVLGPEAANLQFLEITGPTLAAPVRLVRQGEAWNLTSPLDWPANPHAVLRIANELKLLEHEASFAVEDLATNGQSLADYGLDQPQLTVTFSSGGLDATGAATATAALRIGAETPVGNRVYVLSPDGRRVHVVGRSLLDSLRLDPDELRAPTFFSIPFFEVRSLTLQTAAPANLRIRVRRGEGDRWSFENPIVARASRTAVQLAVSGLNTLETRRYLGAERTNPELADRAGLGSGALRVTLEGNNRRETLLLGNEIGPLPPTASGDPEIEFYAKLEDRTAVFSVALPVRLATTLRNAQVELRDRRVLDLDGRTVTAVTLAAPGRPELTLQRLEAAGTSAAPSWQMILRQGAVSGPQTLPADREVVERLIQRLQLLEVVDSGGFLSDAPGGLDLENWGLTRPERTVTVSVAAAAGAPPATLVLQLGVGTEREGRIYAKLANQDFVYLVDPGILTATPVVARSYRERLLRELPPGARITGLTLTDTPAQQPVYARQLAAGETWEQALAAEPPDRRAALEALLAQLATLRAESFVRDDFGPLITVSGEDRPWRYRLDTTLSLVGGDGAQQTVSTLFFSERAGGSTQYAGTPELQGGVVFEAQQPLLDALWTLTYGPRDPGPPVEP